VTHAHDDHVNGICDLRPIFFESKKQAPIFSSPEITEEIRKMFYYLMRKDAPDIYKTYFSLHDVSDSFFVGDIDCICFRQSHGYSETLGLRIGNFAYSTDVVEFPEASFEKLYGLDLWIVGCPARTPKPTHAHLGKILEWVRELKPKMTFLTHMGNDMDYESLLEELPPNVQPAYDGMTLEIS
jgi:phosphoribosyl 1,2-cyclic phosphate phosphodiesterase